MLITHHRTKLINAIIYFANNTKYCGTTKLYKLLFLFDFMCFKKTGKKVTNLNYYAWKNGPVPIDLFHELKKMKPDMSAAIKFVKDDGFQKIVAKKKFYKERFSPLQLKIMSEIVEIFENENTQKVKKSFHSKKDENKIYELWSKTKRDEQIEYMSVIDENDPDSISFELAKKLVNDRNAMYKKFGQKDI